MPSISDLLQSTSLPPEKIWSLLPRTLRDMQPYLTLEQVFIIVDRFKGQTLFIPARLNNEMASLGEETAHQLMKWHIGETLYIGNCIRLLIALRRERVLQLRDMGQTLNQIAREVGWSDRHVRNVLTKLDKQHETQDYTTQQNQG